MRGTIESIEERKTKKGKPYHLVKIDGEAYWAWDADLVKSISKGNVVDYEAEGDEYPKLTSIKQATGETPPSVQKGGYGNNNKSFYFAYAKDIVVALINSDRLPKQISPIVEIKAIVIDMALAFYKASEKGVVEEDSIPEEEPYNPFPPDKPGPESEKPSFDSFNYLLINTKWKTKPEIAEWWAERQKAMLNFSEDERKELIKTYNSELNKIK